MSSEGGSTTARWSRVIADLARVATLLSGIATIVFLGGKHAGGFFVVLAVMVAARVLDIARPFDAAFCVTLLVTTWARQQDWYGAAPWVDEAVHSVTPGATAVALYLMLAKLDVLPSPGEEFRATRRFSLAFLVTIVGLGLAAVWEFYEWIENHYAPAMTRVGYTDTISDMALGGAGSLVAGILLVLWVQARSGGRR